MCASASPDPNSNSCLSTYILGKSFTAKAKAVNRKDETFSTSHGISWVFKRCKALLRCKSAFPSTLPRPVFHYLQIALSYNVTLAPPLLPVCTSISTTLYHGSPSRPQPHKPRGYGKKTRLRHQRSEEELLHLAWLQALHATSWLASGKAVSNRYGTVKGQACTS